jgi:hypothetical protein
MAWEAGCLPFFSAAGFAFVLRGLGESGRPFRNLVAGSLLLAAGMYTYAAYRAVPAAALVFLAFMAVSGEWSVLRRRMVALLVAGAVAFALLAPLLHFAWEHSDYYWRRYADVSLTQYMVYYATPIPWLHQVGKAFLGLNHKGFEYGRYVPRFLDSVTAALFLFGLAARAPAGRRRGLRFVWIWLLVFLGLSSMTRDAPHLTRSLGAAPPVLILAGLGATRLMGYVRSLLPLRSVAPALVAFLILSTTALNAYEYFVALQSVPYTDETMNVRARTLCEKVRRSQPATFFWTSDLEYWGKAQCRFLVPGGYGALNPLLLEDLVDTTRLRNLPGRVLVALGDDFFRRNLDKIPHDGNGEPRLDLPARPKVQLDRQARRLYYLYEF